MLSQNQNLINIFGINKPKGPTSHDVVDSIRQITHIKKVGHAGTLDPLASGVLVIAVGREATKKISEIVKKEKEYIATIKLGQTSTTDDEEGEKTTTVKAQNFAPRRDDIKNIVKQFIGHIQQIPPAYSAIKVRGQTAYKLARKGKDVKLDAREVEIKEIEILEYEWPVLKLRVVTGSGVYIRSLARDIGKELGVDGYLADLVRTRIGDFTLDNSYSIGDFQNYWVSSRPEIHKVR